MKRSLKIPLLCSLLLLSAAVAALGAPAPAASAVTNQMIIEADDGFQYDTPRLIWRQNVHVTDPQMELMCELLTVFIETNNNKMELIVAETNVVLVHEDSWAVGDRAVFNLTNDLIELTGNVVLETPQYALFSSQVNFDRKNNKFSAPGKVKMTGVLSGTNMPNFNLPGIRSSKPEAPPPLKPPDTR